MIRITPDPLIKLVYQSPCVQGERMIRITPDPLIKLVYQSPCVQGEGTAGR